MENDEGDEEKDKNSNDEYDPFKREPLYSNAEISCLWELVALSHHFHPTV